MNEKSVIAVTNINKEYMLYEKNTDQLLELLFLGKKSFHKPYKALDNISFEVKKGENIGIIGTNGSGKSTLLKIITGVVKPTSGTVEINGKISALLELGAGFNPNYTGMENIYLNGMLMGYSREEMEKKIDDIVGFADIGEFIHQPVKNYSSGMFARLAFAVAINVEPDILIVDEALSVGDIFFQSKCYRKFEEFKKKGKTILFVTHDMASVSRYCDRVLLLNKGVAVAQGSPKEMIDIYKKILVNQFDEKDLEDITENENNEAENIGETALEDIVYKEKLQTNPAVIDYGTKAAEIVDFALIDENGLITNSMYSGSEVTILMRVLFHEDISDPIFAYTLKDVMGLELVGTNTMFEGIDTGIVKKGEIKEIRFKQKLCLQAGEFLLSLGCTGYSKGKFEVYSRLYDVCSMTMINSEQFVGKWNAHSEIVVR